MNAGRRALRLLASLAGVGAITWIAYGVIPVNATTVGFAYLLFVLVIATTWGFLEATLASIVATLTYNFFFLEPKLTFTIADPQNWVALFAFLATSLLASRLSTKARQRTMDALERQRDLERLYTFGRAILLIDDKEPFAKQLAIRLAETFELDAVALYDSRTRELYRAGPSEFDGMDSQLRDAAVLGTSFADHERKRIITSVRLGSAPIASIAIQGARMPDSVLQSIANLVAIGLERAKAQELGHEVEVARRSDHLRTTLIDAMAHEFKTPLTSIRAATTALLSSSDLKAANASQLLKIADEEASHLEKLIDNAVDIAQLESNHIDVDLDLADVNDLVSEVVKSMKNELADRRLVFEPDKNVRVVAVDRRLLKLAVKQLVDNALKYSPANEPIVVRTSGGENNVSLEVTDMGKGISEQDQARIFDRFYRGSSVENQIPGSGLGLSIAQRIVQAHQGNLTVRSHPGETTFHLELPVQRREGKH
jgi:two-component system, OmpR family, sensor histidine kinase KdpD